MRGVIYKIHTPSGLDRFQNQQVAEDYAEAWNLRHAQNPTACAVNHGTNEEPIWVVVVEE